MRISARAHSGFDDLTSQLDAELAHFVRLIRFFLDFSLLNNDSLNDHDNREVRNEFTAIIRMLRNASAVKETVNSRS